MRTYLYLNGERVAINNLYNTNHGQYYYGSDILGSVRFITGQSGQELNRIEYDIFGGIYKGASPYGLETGYTGKPYDAVTGLSDYGFRDYSPAYARFITEDPIRDDENWFAYVGNNPVNYIDPWGLSASDGKGQTDTDIPKVTFSLDPQKIMGSQVKMDSNLYGKSLIEQTAENSRRKQAFEKSSAFLKAPAEKNTKSSLEYTIEANTGTLTVNLGKQLVRYTSSDNTFRSECKFNGEISMNGITIDADLSVHIGNNAGGISMHTEVNTSSTLSFKHPLRDSRSEITLFRVYLQMDYKRR